jgi:hypothetical protein
MAFTNAQLKTELTTDPTSLGYAPLITAGNLGGVESLINKIQGTITVFRNDVAPREVVQCIAAADFNAAAQIAISKLEMMFISAPLDCTLANVRANMQGIFTGASAATTNALSAVAQRNGSRAEQLWGTGTLVSSNDIMVALHS